MPFSRDKGISKNSETKEISYEHCFRKKWRLLFQVHPLTLYALQAKGKEEKKGSDIASLPLRGSVTIEASLIMTVMTTVIVSFLFLFEVMLVQVKIQQALNQATEQLAVYVYVKEVLPDLLSEPDEDDDDDDDDDGYSGPAIISAGGDRLKELISNGFEIGYLALLVRRQLQEEEYIKRCVVGGNSGLDFSWSMLHLDVDYIDAKVQYRIQLWGLPKPFHQITYIQRCRRRCWFGVEPEDNEEEAKEDKDVVFVTKRGSVYHEYKDCSHLTRRIITVEWDKLKKNNGNPGEGYRACEFCVGNSPNRHIYYTAEGECYHNRSNCRVLMRYILEIDRSQIGERKKCSLCEKRQKEEKKEKEVNE